MPSLIVLSFHILIMIKLTVVAILIVLALSAHLACSFRGVSSRWVTPSSRTRSSVKRLLCVLHADGDQRALVANAENMRILNEVIEQASNTQKAVVIDFSTSVCEPCQRIAPMFEKLAKDFEAKALFVKVCLCCLPFLDY